MGPWVTYECRISRGVFCWLDSEIERQLLERGSQQAVGLPRVMHGNSLGARFDFVLGAGVDRAVFVAQGNPFCAAENNVGDKHATVIRVLAHTGRMVKGE